ncbi:MAG: F0F1 ATP synthase subunit A [Bryobacter sp.]|nr:F0F1 ATP synthase subunit A [Bryobacter sp.]
MHEHELWFTALLNQYLAGPANSAMALVGQHAHDAAKPWTNYNSMLLLSLLVMLVLPWLVRGTLSMDKPGKLSQLGELFVEFIKGHSKEVIGHDGPKYRFWFMTMFLGILIMNLVGLVPTLESPTMYPAVPLGFAVASFFYYNAMGVKEQGLLGHLKHFAGPVMWLAPLMFPLEIISHLIRPMSLTIRLYANMFAGEQITISFIELTKYVIPVVFMALHFFVSFLQAYIFTTLSMAYVGGAVAHEDH